MKKCFIVLLFFNLSYSVWSQNEDQQNIAEIEKKAHAGFFKSVSSANSANYDLKYHRCEWEIDPAVKYIKGSITSYFKIIAGNFIQMQFDLSDSLRVDSVKYHNTHLNYGRLSGDVLQINFSSVLALNSLDSITIYYQGIPYDSGFGSFVQTTHNEVPIIWTLSEPFGAKDWWPCKQSLNDKIDSIDIIVTTPQSYRVASNGLLTEEKLSGSNKIYHWQSHYPIAAYLVAIAVTNYTYYSDYIPLVNDSIEVLNYIYPEDSTSIYSQSKDIIRIIELYDSLTIIYPFVSEKYGHAQFGWGGGMEHQTMSFIVSFNFSLMAHECAHQWFGDHVTCGSWEDIWLNEGFATYFEGIAVERYFPENWISWKQSHLDHIVSLPDGSVRCEDTTQVSRIFNGRLSYNKGAYLLHMLRWKLGDSLFFLGIKNYLNDPNLAGSYAKTPDFKNHLEMVSGQNLTNFFAQWYYGEGYPSYHVTWGQTGSLVNLTIDQNTSDSSVSFFEMPIPIRFLGKEQDTIIVFDHQFSGQNFNATIGFPVISIQFDPELWLISDKNRIFYTTDLALENQVKIYPNPVSDDKIHIAFLNNANTVEKIEITDLAGKIVYLSQQYAGIQKNISIDITMLVAGTYIIKCTLTSGVNCKKMIRK